MNTNLKEYLKTRKPIIWYDTNNYKEIDLLLEKATEDIKNKKIYEYRDIGQIDFKTKKIENKQKDLYEFLNEIYYYAEEGYVYLVLKNLHISRKISLYLEKIAELMYSNSNFNFFILIVSDIENIPKELKRFITILEIPRMSSLDIKEHIINYIKNNNLMEVDFDKLNKIIFLFKGMDRINIDYILNSMNENNILNLDKNIIFEEKKQMIQKLESFKLINISEDIKDIGGLNEIKNFYENKRKIFENIDEAINYGIDRPRSLMILGMPGCGKSLIARLSSIFFDYPLVELDLSKILASSEKQIKKDLKNLTSIGICVLLIDGFEKFISKKNLLTMEFLNWLQEKENPIFVIATNNTILNLPFEIFGKNIFDEIFFIDFPNEFERKEIFEIHLKKRKKEIKNFNCLELSKKTVGYSGAEIEKIIKLTLEKTFLNKNNLEMKNFLETIQEITPISIVFKKQIELLRKNIKKLPLKKASSKNFENISLENRAIKENIITKDKNFILVEGGKYKASFFDEERKVENLYVSKYLITQEIWEEIMGDNPSIFKGRNLPIESISWWKALEFCNILSILHKLEPVYDIQVENNIPKLMINQLNDIKKDADSADFKRTEGYRLPTELEWEWFARGGRNFLDEENIDLKNIAWYKDNSLGKTHEVGKKNPNSLGLYDIIGNVYEWCYDNDVKLYLSEEKPYRYINGARWIVRGGAYSSYPFYSFSSSYIIKKSQSKLSIFSSYSSSSGSSSIGLRIVRNKL